MSDEYKYCAFFDVDGTIISMKTMFSFLEYYDKKTILNLPRKNFMKRVKLSFFL